jgi:membrane protein YdbS with pleckstrin-like domain
MIDESPQENEKNYCNPEYEKFLMKVLIWKTLLQTPLWWSCSGLMIWMIGLIMEEESNPLIWIVSGILNFLITFIIILVISYPIGKWYYRTQVKNHWWALGETVIFVHSGVLTHQLGRIPYNRIQNLNTKQGWFDRKGDYSKVEIETAGRSGAYLAEGTIFGIKNPEEIIKKIAEKVKIASVENKMSSQDNGGITDVKVMRSPESLESATEILQKIYNKLDSIENLLKKT